ncbi:cytochrome P450 [Spongiibacter taiwanensis]|uniref:cytochrome P450 n=1 Tax=Spongiibacter taiwanensis TaxID=1748242 RepID=UPI002035EEE0|nr:cytochrome P450 [Spongiibacter taiwanensis]USA42625.1 cytochrome P450 [Spongiibacter taiwanensis]
MSSVSKRDVGEFALATDDAAILVDPTAYADGRVLRLYRRLQQDNPVAWAAPPGYSPFWVLTRFEDIERVSMDHLRFPYGDRPSVLFDAASEALMRATTGKPYAVRTLVTVDEPDHCLLRQITQSWFMPRNLQALGPRIQAIADEALAAMMTKGPVIDFVEEVALHYPLRIIMEILGVPEADYPLMLKLTQEIFAPADPDSVPEGVDCNDPAFFAAALQSSAEKISRYFRTLVEARRRHPQDDIATLLATASIEGRPLSDEELAGYFIIIATAGHDTTSSTTAAVMYALATQPGLLARVQGDMSLVPALIEEAIRWGSPVKTFMRSVSEDMVFGGRQFRTGDWLMLCYAAANRDPAIYEEGERFDLARGNARHLAFGKGIHMCLGQHLARLEIKALFDRLIPRLASVALCGEVTMSNSYFVNGFKHLPVRIRYL